MDNKALIYSVSVLILIAPSLALDTFEFDEFCLTDNTVLDDVIIYRNSTQWVCAGYTNSTGLTSNSTYLIDDGTSIWVNETFLNATIDARAGNDTDNNCSTPGSCPQVAYMNYSNKGNFSVSDNFTAGKYKSVNGTLGYTLTDDGNNLILTTDVAGNNYFEIGTDGAFIDIYSNPNPANGYILATITETQGENTTINFYEGGTGHNRIWDSGSMRIGGNESYLCSVLTSDVDCDTQATGADLVVQNDIWAGGMIMAGNWTNVSINTTQITDYETPLINDSGVSKGQIQTAYNMNFTGNNYLLFNPSGTDFVTFGESPRFAGYFGFESYRALPVGSGTTYEGGFYIGQQGLADHWYIAYESDSEVSVCEFANSADCWLEIGAGTFTNPSLIFTGDTDTGLYRAAFNKIGFVTGGKQNLNISQTEITAAVNVTLTQAADCFKLPGGGKICGNTTCSIVYSPDGGTVVEVCN